MPSFGLKRRGKKRRAAAAEEEERLSRSNSEYSSDEETPKREKSKPIWSLDKLWNVTSSRSFL